MVTVSAWEDDPKSDPSAKPVSRPVPALEQRRFGVAMVGEQPLPERYRHDTSGFRYWNAAASLTRAAQFWAGLVPAPTQWVGGGVLPATIDAGHDLNAYYDRHGLYFFHAHVAGEAVYSGESPDVLCHELGHAVLDAIVPSLWNTAAIEAAAFHESFGDISAMLSALQLESVRTAVLEETSGRLSRSSRISRLAEQLGWAIRQSHPDAVDRDCLRNAANSFFYSEPEALPPLAPASVLSSQPHSFSRVFTAAWLDALAGMFTTIGASDEQGQPGDARQTRHAGSSPADLLRVSQDAGVLLVQAARSAPIASNFFAQVAAEMIRADAARFHGTYRTALRRAFVGRGVLSASSAARVMEREDVSHVSAARQAEASPPRWMPVSIDGGTYGLSIGHVMVEAPQANSEQSVASAAPDLGSVPPVSPERASRAFVEDLLRRGRIDPGPIGVAHERRGGTRRQTHIFERDGDAVRLVRQRIH
ncbi:MAG: hypothetical protein WCP29_05425 [Acidobacteriota bacterium]